MGSSLAAPASLLWLVGLVLASAQQDSNCPGCVHGVCKQIQDTQSSYTCVCNTGFTGTYCNITTAPAPAPATLAVSSEPATIVGTSTACTPGCANKGVCSLYSNGTSACDCSGTGYVGPTCSVDASGSQTWSGASNRQCNPSCENGGRCIQQQNSEGYYCECSGTGYSGAACTVRAGQATPSPPPAAVAPTAQTSTENSVGGSPASTAQGLGGGAVVGIIAIVLAAFILIAAGLVLWRRRRSNNRFEKFSDRQSMEIQAPYTTSR